MSFQNPNYLQPCLSWCSSPFTPAAWRACTFQSSSPQINWGFFFSPLVSSPDIFWESKVIISWVEAAGRRRDSHASDSRDVIWRFCPERSSFPTLWAVSCEEIHTADQSLTENVKHFIWNHNYTVFIILAVWTVVTVAVSLASATFKFGWELVRRWREITQEMSQSRSFEALAHLCCDKCGLHTCWLLST